MPSRQLREARKEYPTGHNRGNERAGDTARGGPRTFGAPTGPTQLTEEQRKARDEERRRLLETRPTAEERRRAIEEHEEGGREETRQRAETEAANRRTEAPEPSPTSDLSAYGAGEKIRQRPHNIDEYVEETQTGRPTR